MKRKIKEGETCQTIYVPENEIPSVIWANIFCANTKNFQKKLKILVKMYLQTVIELLY